MATNETFSKAQIRNQLEIASMLARSGIGFVVMPVMTAEGFAFMCQKQAEKLEKLAAAAEALQEGS